MLVKEAPGVQIKLKPSPCLWHLATYHKHTSYHLYLHDSGVIWWGQTYKTHDPNLQDSNLSNKVCSFSNYQIQCVEAHGSHLVTPWLGLNCFQIYCKWRFPCHHGIIRLPSASEVTLNHMNQCIMWIDNNWWYNNKAICKFSYSRKCQDYVYVKCLMSSNGNIFHVTGPIPWIPLTKACDIKLWCFLWSSPQQNSWASNQDAIDLRCHHAHYKVTEMLEWYCMTKVVAVC